MREKKREIKKNRKRKWKIVEKRDIQITKRVDREDWAEMLILS